MLKTIVAGFAALLALSACSNDDDGEAHAVAGRGATANGGASAGSASGARGGAGAGTTNGGSANDTVIEPPSLVLTAREGGTGVLQLLALTVRQGASGVEVYVSSKNVGAIPACEASIAVELFDASQGSLAAGVTGLLTQHLFRLTDGSGTRASCVGMGDVTMAAVTGFPPSVALADIAYIQYSYSYFAIDVEPIDGLTVSDVTGSELDGGTTYSGTFGNGLDVAVSNPGVTVFALNGVGRPLGLATASGTAVVAPGGTWAFTTGRVDATGAGYAAYPTATPSD
jgi:hypothetical protein